MAMRIVAALVALALSACATAPATKTPPEQIPAIWIDLPEAPFVARTVGRKAILVNRSKQTYRSVATGCVNNEAGRVKVLWGLMGVDRSGSGWPPGDHVEGLLRDIGRLDYYIANQRNFTGRDDVLERCPEGAAVALISSSGPDGKWQAEGTAWQRN